MVKFIFFHTPASDPSDRKVGDINVGQKLLKSMSDKSLSFSVGSPALPHFTAQERSDDSSTKKVQISIKKNYNEWIVGDGKERRDTTETWDKEEKEWRWRNWGRWEESEESEKKYLTNWQKCFLDRWSHLLLHLFSTADPMGTALSSPKNMSINF